MLTHVHASVVFFVPRNLLGVVQVELRVNPEIIILAFLLPVHV